MRTMDAARKVGLWFWGMTFACMVLAVYGLVRSHPGLIMGGFMGTAWFLMLACMPREWFLKEVPDEPGRPPASSS